MKHLSDHSARVLLEGPKFGVGIQIEFYYHWSKWITTQTETRPIKDAVNNTPIQSCQTPLPKTMDLNDILSDGPYGPGVVQHYKKYGSLNEKIQNLLLEAFLYYCINKNIAATKADCQSLAAQICETFKGEIPVRDYILY